MNIIRKPIIQSYWSIDKTVESPCFKNIIPYKTFLDNNSDSNDLLIKIREVSDIIAKNFIRMYKPHKIIDEQKTFVLHITYSKQTKSEN